MISRRPHPSIVVRAAIAATIALSILATAGTAVAQCPPVQPTEFAIDSATTVFVGQVVATEDQGTTAEMRVLSVWKGRDLPETVQVSGSAGSATTSSDARRFDVGRSYLVIPENSREPFLATACNATQAYSAAPNVIPSSYQDGTGAARGRPPIVTDSGVDSEAKLLTSILPLVGAIGLIALAWLVIRSLRSLEPERGNPVATEKALPGRSGPETRTFKRRSLRRDVIRTKMLARRKVKRHGRGLRAYRRRQNRQVAASRKNRR
jgi:hypothetical protein